MKTITLKKLKIENFKKIKSLEIDFNEKTSIHADNGVGKTTIFDSFTWLLFGKDSLGSAQFDIKTLDKNNNPVHKKEHSVEAVILCDNDEHTIKRVYREKWTKKRGDETESFDGHETIYEINAGVYSQKDFKEFVSNIIDENQFRLLTSITYFHSLKWEERRKILYSLVDDVSDLDAAKGNADFETLVKFLNGKDFENYRKDIKAKISPIKKELERLSGEIEGTRKNIPDDIDVVSLKKELESLGDPNSINNEIIKKRAEIQNEIQQKIAERNAQINEETKKSLSRQREIIEAKEKIKVLEKRIDTCFSTREDLIEEWNKVKSEQFSPTSCHACGVNTFEVQKVLSKSTDEEAIALFNKLAEANAETEESFKNEKAKKLADIDKRGADNNATKDDCIAQISELKEFIENNPLISVDRTPFDSSELEASMPELKDVDTEITSKIASINQEIGRQKEIDEMKERLKSAEAKELDLSKQLASLEKTQFVCEKFARVKSDLFVEKINKMFTFVTFKLFEKQINGGEAECCETLVDGVPFSTNVNTGAKVNAGIDILNVLSNKMQVKCPVFIDNMESCTSPIEVQSQSIFLVVEKGVKSLQIK